MDQIVEWLLMLGALLNPALPGEPMKKLRVLLPHLRTLPRAAFTDESARRVVEAQRYGSVPDWSVMAPVLRAYLREIRPFMPALAAPRQPDREPPTPEEIDRVSAILRGLPPPVDPWAGQHVTLPDVSLKGEILEIAKAESGALVCR